MPYVPWRCKQCGDTKPRTYGQRGRVRFHECKRCGLFFKSLEIDPDQLGDLTRLLEKN